MGYGSNPYGKKKKPVKKKGKSSAAYWSDKVKW
jgi:hypothetical protein